jgi:hypothetical protein
MARRPDHRCADLRTRGHRLQPDSDRADLPGELSDPQIIQTGRALGVIFAAATQ